MAYQLIACLRVSITELKRKLKANGTLYVSISNGALYRNTHKDRLTAIGMATLQDVVLRNGKLFVKFVFRKLAVTMSFSLTGFYRISSNILSLTVAIHYKIKRLSLFEV